MSTLAELLAPTSAEAILAALYARLELDGFPGTNWTDGGIERTLCETIAVIVADFAGPLAATIASWASLETSTGDALTIRARSDFETLREPASFAVWTVRITDSAAAGPFVVAAGSLLAVNSIGQIFTNLTATTIPLSGFANFEFRAESPGTAYNANQPISLITILAGVTLSLQSLTTSGTDEETDSELITRCRLKWSTLGTGGSKPAFALRALNADPEIRRVSVRSDDPAPGQVLVVVASTDSTATAPAVAAAQAANAAEDVIPECVSVTTEAAIENPINITATVTILAASQPAAAARINDDLLALLRAQRISEADPVKDKVYLAAILCVFQDLPGVIVASLSTPASDTALADKEIAVLGTVTPIWIQI